LEKRIGYIPKRHKFKSYQANTAIAHHSKRTFALVEVDFPLRIKVEKKPEKFDVKRIGYEDFDG